MITYRKKSLKVKNIYSDIAEGGDGDCYGRWRTPHTHRLANELRKFIEKGEYSRIVDIKIYGTDDITLVCSIIYEQGTDANTTTGRSS